MSKKVGISIVEFQTMYDDRRALEIAAEVGADAVDVGTFTFSDRSKWDYRNPDSLYHKGESAIVDHYAGLREYAKSLGLIISQTHGRGVGFVGKEDDDRAEVENVRLDLVAAAALGAPVCVVHSPTSIIHGPDVAPEYMRALGYRQYMEMLPHAARNKVKLATETFGDATGRNCLDFFGDVDEFIDLYNRVKTDSPYGEWFTACMDTGHSHKSTRFNNPKVGDVIRRIGSAITVLHLNDNDTLTDQHKPPLTGSIDWTDTFNALDEIGYDGVYNMELILARFGRGTEEATAEFAIKIMKNFLRSRG